MNLAEEAHHIFFPGKREDREITLKYSGKYKGYNASVRHTNKKIVFGLSKEWKEVDEDIQLGLLHLLYLRMYKLRGKSIQLDLYNSFMKRVGTYVVPEKQDAGLLERFHLINEEYLSGLLEPPNLVWGGENVRVLGHYDYGTNTITLSEVMRHAGELLNYVIYHEMLHMKFRLEFKGMRAIHHSREFREWERKFKLENAEKKLNEYLRKKRWKRFLGF
jgi:hypothetical protein